MAKKRVLLGMSGGTDSSVAAILLKQKGFEVVGITFRSYDSISKSCMEKETGCCNVDSIFEAKKLANDLGFEHHILDIRDYFADTIINNFINEYLSGNTPNPCVLCNKLIKWGRMIEEADNLNCDYLATGHYARIVLENNRYYIRKGVDQTKDQSYFLWAIPQEYLSRTIFPLGNFTKTEVRKIAVDNGYTKIANKRESQEICFIPDDDYRRFLREAVPDIDNKIGEGNFVDKNGKILGKHKGYPFYTIGQRKGLNIALGQPTYVLNIDAQTNTITLGEAKDLLKNEVPIQNINFMKYEKIPEDFQAICKIRYNNKGEKCRVIQYGDKIKIIFENPVSAVTPGQSAVIYENEDIVCGGIITNL
ncbi:MAG TPA: tRNA 2-thiouridine(34) synthase MnmA [Bacteroidales bacterium]|jgi:tRNA-specific 2-thiouridylase|nr:tRNA 2-thiouridine(34) synthase MnmA [Bacteroidales bacterium]HOL98261.1 tRNA 2-thiouridine(34) synthase MnmA [Bacteroidales bacterium]HOM36614.1 tRNA 2-thiouridine(34) synthase MnmA [Bacteroidales bacterium]HPD24040.1 tRNA 2-thiouridine(34) synthase MnmA [Bacteroidales bacterium]HRT00009.1 tRNA 2-thiouridine(34) synthase MnmA [Bacteroidales bacterium]